MEIFRVSENSLAANYNAKQDSETILEFTIDIPHGKMLRLSQEKQEAKLLLAVRSGLEYAGFPDVFTHYFERCGDGIIHIHGCIDFKPLYLGHTKGVIESFARGILKSIDGRLQLRPDDYYYPYYERYRSPLMCIQFTDDAERIVTWKQYITKYNRTV